MKKFTVSPSFKRNISGAMPNVPQIEGLRPDLSNQDKARFYADNGIKMKGITFQSIVGTTNEIVIDLSGTAKMLIGFKIVHPNSPNYNAGVRFSITINQEQVINDSFVDCHDTANNFDGEYTPLVRMLSGKDNIRLSFTDIASNKVGIEFWYI